MTLQQQQQVSTSSSIEGNITKKDIETGLDFILSHFEEPIFPRKISTHKTKGGQFFVSNEQETINSFRNSNWLDCRINAFPPLTNYKEVQICPPNLLFIDLDKNDFKTLTALKLALDKTLRNIKEKLNASPSVVLSGNGYHIIQPVSCPIPLENIPEFEKFDKPSEQFLRFAKHYFSNGRADKNHNPSFKSCLLRIPGSINSKNMQQVTIVQKWNGYRPRLTIDLMDEFISYLIQKKIDEDNLHHRHKILNARRRKNRNNNNYSYYYDWIETKVLQNDFSDYRKLIVGLILVPYLVVIKKLSYEETYRIINEWLIKCDSVRKLDFDPKSLVNNNIKTSVKKLIPPISIYRLEANYRNLYLLLDQNNNTSNPRISNQTERERGV